MRVLLAFILLSTFSIHANGQSATESDAPDSATPAFVDAYAAEDYERAAQLAQDALTNEDLPRDLRGQAHMAVAKHHIRTGDDDLARAALDEALGLLDKPTMAHYERFQLAFKAEDWITAAKDLTAFTKERPDLARPIHLSAIQTIQYGVTRLQKDDLVFEMLLALRDARYSGAPADTRPDPLYTDLAQMLAVRGRRFEAEALINLIHETDLILHMMTDQRFSALWSALDVQFGTAASITARELEFLGKARRQLPNSLKLVRQYMQDLRRHGLSSQAAQLGSTVIKQIQSAGQSIAASPDGLWVANELAYALLDLNQNDEAITLLGQLAGLDSSKVPGLVSQQINYAAVLLWGERYVSALQAAPIAETGSVSGYGQAFIRQIAICAYDAMGRDEDAIAALGPLLDQPFVNPRATQIALLCLDRHEDGVLHLIKRLENPQTRKDALLALIEPNLDRVHSPFFQTLHERFDALRDDERIVEAQERVGRAIDLQIRPIYWGAF